MNIAKGHYKNKITIKNILKNIFNSYLYRTLLPPILFHDTL